MKAFFALCALMTLSSAIAHADATCDVKEQQAAQAVARFNGLSGDYVESPYSNGLSTITVDKTQTYIVYATGSNSTCSIDGILLAENSQSSNPVSDPACNVKLGQLVQKLAQLNGEAGQNISSSYSANNQFAFTVDGQKTYSIRTDAGKHCLIEQVSLNAQPNNGQMK